MAHFHGAITAVHLHGNGESQTATAPTAPTTVAGSASGGTTATITWVDASSDETGFDVQIESPTGSSNWVAASGATNPTAAGVQTFAATGLTAATSYTPRVQSFNGTGSSAWVTGASFATDNTGSGGGDIPALSAPAIVTNPSNMSVVEGATASFTAAFSGSPAPSVQWYRGASLLTGETALTYSFATVLADSGAVFTCTATNSMGSVTTSAATLTVTAAPPVAPSITLQPIGASVSAGAAATFVVVAAGTAPLSYQWRKNGSSITGATSASYTTPATVEGDDGALFSVVVTNSAGTVTSSNATLTVGGSMESQLAQLLAAICPRAFPDVAPLSTARPYITYQQIGGQSLRYVEHRGRQAPPPDADQCVGCRVDANNIAHAIEDAMCVTTVLSRGLMEGIATAEEDMGLTGLSTFDIWSTR